MSVDEIRWIEPNSTFTLSKAHEYMKLRNISSKMWMYVDTREKIYLGYTSGKKRHNPEKKQNNYGGDYDCENYEERNNGKEWCHDEGQVGWGEWIKWAQTDNDGKLKCNGNRHNCIKMRQKWLASLPEIEKKKIWKK